MSEKFYTDRDTRGIPVELVLLQLCRLRGVPAQLNPAPESDLVGRQAYDLKISGVPVKEVIATQPAGREIHVILDNFATHKTDLVKQFLADHLNVTLHFTPTYSSWLNQVESWFSRLQRDVIDRGIFTSVADLRRKILRYIRLYQKASKPFRWKYSDPSRRIPTW